MAKKSSKGPVQRMCADLPARKPGAWMTPVVFDPKAKTTVPDVNPEFALRPSKASLSKPVCSRKAKSGEAKKGLRDCHVELVFNEGTFLRLCTGEKQKSPLIPVASHADATRISNQFCACRKSGKDPGTCATEIAPGAPLGGRGRGRQGRRR
jgi:hypothetical protein